MKLLSFRNRRRILPSFGVILSLVLSFTETPPSVEAQAPSNIWHLGLGRADITPPEPIFMSGYASRTHPAEGTRIPLWAKTLAFKPTDSTPLSLWITLDLVGIDRDTSLQLRQSLSEEFKIPFERILISVSHTHTGPIVGTNLRPMYTLSPSEEEKIKNYTQYLIQQIHAATRQSLESLSPGLLSWSNGQATFGTNRRNNVESKVPELRAQGALKGPVDDEVPILRIAHPDGTLRAVVFGYACHATVLSDYQWSGDYPGFAQRLFESQNPDTQAMFFAGCGADINPLPRRTVELAENYGQQLVDAVQVGLQGLQNPLAPSLSIRYNEIPIPLEKQPSRQELQAEMTHENRYVAQRARWLLERWDQGNPPPTTYPYPIATWRFGNELTLVTLGGEVVVDYALRIKTELDSSTWVAAYSHDVMAYIPSLRVWNEGGYEGETSMIYYGLPSRWAPSIEEQILTEIHHQNQCLIPKASP